MNASDGHSDIIDRMRRIMFDPARPHWLLEHAISDVVGVDKESAGNMIMMGIVPVNVVKLICVWRGVSAHWILFGDGDIWAQSCSKGVDVIDSDDPEANSNVKDILRTISRTQKKIEDPALDTEHLIDCLMMLLKGTVEDGEDEGVKRLMLEVCGYHLRCLARQPHCNLTQLRTLIANRFEPFLAFYGLEIEELSGSRADQVNRRRAQ